MATAAKTNSKSNIGDVEKQIAVLREDISNLTSAVANTGVAKAAEAKNALQDKGAQAAEVSKQQLAALRKELDILDDKVTKHVKEKPYQSLAIAAGVGVLAAILMKK